MELSRDEAIKKLEKAQDLLSDIYTWAHHSGRSDIEQMMSVADGCIIDAYELFRKEEGNYHDDNAR